MLFKELIQEYSKLDDFCAPNKERLNIRSEIALLINSGLVGKEWYLSSQILSLLNYVPTSNNPSCKRVPSLTESIIATEALDKKYQEIVEILKPRVKSVIKIGSSTWAENFNVRHYQKDRSDLDIEVLIDDVSSSLGVGFPGAEKGLDLFSELYKQGKADYFSYGFKEDGIPISIHFMPTSVFEENCNINCAAIFEDKRRVEFRTKPKSKPPIYNERYDGWGTEYVFRGKPQKINGGVLTEVPVLMIGDKGQIVMGLVMSKYFTSPKVSGDEKYFQENIKKFKRSLSVRLMLEGGGKFEEMPARKGRMPEYVLKQLAKEQNDYELDYLQEYY